ncbi:MAG: hypothetical protein ACK4NE_07870 [Albidovulum sp.]
MADQDVTGGFPNAPTLTDHYGAGVEEAGVRHTPGPWHACKDGACTCKVVWCADHPIADVASGEWGDEYPAIRLDQEGIGAKAEAYLERLVYGSIDPTVAAANARLIAAAPDMLETEQKLAAEVGGLRAFEQEIRAAIGNTNWSLLMQRLAEANAAIAKATPPQGGK